MVQDIRVHVWINGQCVVQPLILLVTACYQSEGLIDVVKCTSCKGCLWTYYMVLHVQLQSVVTAVTGSRSEGSDSTPVYSSSCTYM